MIKTKMAFFWRAGFYPANQKCFQKALIGWKKAGPPKKPLLFWSCKQAKWKVWLWCSFAAWRSALADSVIKPESLFVVSLLLLRQMGKALNGKPQPLNCQTGNSLTRKPKRSLSCLLVKVPWHMIQTSKQVSKQYRFYLNVSTFNVCIIW